MFIKSQQKIISLLLLILLHLFTVGCEADTSDSSKKTPIKKTPAAIEFIPELPWLNVSRPLTLKDLRGKVVILDFWTYGCINCIHVLEDFRRLEHKYGNKLVVIGIHTPKFDNERNIETLRRIVVRYGIEHPVVNDIDALMGRQYGMRAWPTQFVDRNCLHPLLCLTRSPLDQLFVETIDDLLKNRRKV